MICPRCEKHTLEERERESVTIDICKECRGIWLDRGELEKLIARSTNDRETFQGREYDDDDDFRGGRDGQKGDRRRGRFGGLFDFLD
jgi:uncharacterized protein